jgi:hypothetical protein
MYDAPFDAISVTTDADQDIFEITAGSGKVIVLHSFSLTSAQTTDERVRLRLIRRTTAGSGGSTSTVVATDAGNAVAASGSVKYLVTTPGSAGNLLKGWQWSQQGELLYLPTPETRIVVAASGLIALNLQSAVGGTRTWSGYVTFEEI